MEVLQTDVRRVHTFSSTPSAAGSDMSEVAMSILGFKPATELGPTRPAHDGYTKTTL